MKRFYLTFTLPILLLAVSCSDSDTPGGEPSPSDPREECRFSNVKATPAATSADFSDSYLYLGRAYAATGDYNYASSVYNNYLSKQGPNAEIYNELGLCEMAKKEYQNALAAFQAGKQIEGNSLMQTLCFNEIVAYEYLEDYQQAEVLMNAYLQNYPDDQTAIREQQFLSTR